MFSAKNYGLPKDLIEAAKRVHEKQLEENLDKSIKKPKNEYKDFTGLSKALDPAFEKIKKQRKEDLKSEEVQFTEEELAEAFAIFLEENFHVDMLTEEDLDYVFEEEFPQWLEESGLSGAFARPERTGRSAQRAARRLNKPIISQSPQDAHVGLTKAARHDDLISSSRKKILKDNPATTKTNQTTREGRPVTSGGTLPSSMVQGDTEGGYTSAPKPTARKQVSAKPAASARKPAPKIDYKTPVTRRGPDGTYGLTSKGRKYVARKEAQERKKPFSASKFFSQMQQDGN